MVQTKHYGVNRSQRFLPRGYAEDSLGLVYYNYRHYNPTDGRWLGRDKMAFKSDYLMVGNNPVAKFEQNGLLTVSIVWREI
ncbi:MAG: RHS repeat-associated core domain-containing protein [Candidatus Spyradenecus sp.]